MKEELIKFLENDCVKIQQKMEKALETGDVGTYRNLMKTLAEATDLIRKNEWKLKYSEYETDGHKEVAVWEQNYDGEIRNHKKWETVYVYSGVPTKLQMDKDRIKVGDFILVESEAKS